jgi:hypothetical protein
MTSSLLQKLDIQIYCCFPTTAIAMHYIVSVEIESGTNET